MQDAAVYTGGEDGMVKAWRVEEWSKEIVPAGPDRQSRAKERSKGTKFKPY